MRRLMPGSVSMSLFLALSAGTAVTQSAMGQTVFYQENFDSATLNQKSGDPRVLGACNIAGNVFTHTPPSGWNWDASGVPTFACRTGLNPCGTCSSTNDGFREYEGWSFLKKDFWITEQGDQERSQFTLGTGVVAVADPDGWDDKGSPVSNCGYYNAFMTTPAISLASADPASLVFSFDSSWRYEGFDDGPSETNNQTAIIQAIFTVGGVDQPPVDVLHWDSDDGSNSGTGFPSAFFKPDATNELVVIDTASGLNVPVGATAVKFKFGMTNAGNDWWWAVDNLALSSTGGTHFTEDFEGVTLEPAVDAAVASCATAFCDLNTYTHDLPNGMTQVVGSPASGGVPDYFGWTLMQRPTWVCLSGGPNGVNFNSASGNVAIADGDEYDDITHPAGLLDTTMSTPAIDVSAAVGNVLVLTFNSSWRWEDPQSATVEAEYRDSGGALIGVPEKILRWESDPTSVYFKPDAEDEVAAAPMTLPAGTKTVTLKFNYKGGNNWWWAIDNISVFEGLATITVTTNTPSQSVMVVADSVDYPLCFAPWSPTLPAGWDTIWNPCGTPTTPWGRPEETGWTNVAKQWWVEFAGDQDRSLFAKGKGFIAIADNDEWDDQPNGRSIFNAFAKSPAIALPPVLSSASLQFDSSWRPEGFDDLTSCPEFNPSGTGTDRLNNQTGTIQAYYTVGGVEQAPVTILNWDSDNRGGIPGPNFKPYAINETVTLSDAQLQIPSGAQSVRFEYGMTKARNDWFWAIDNISFSANGSTVFTEDFENPSALQAPLTEVAPVATCKYFSSVAAQGGYSVDNAGLVGCTSSDFSGFNAWLVDAWARGKGGLRGEFGGTTAYISDFQSGACGGQAYLISPSFNIAGLNESSLSLSFRSGWLNQAGHISTVEVSYDGGSTWTNVLNWTPGTKPTTTDEIVTVGLGNPSGATTATIRFGDKASGWWAISDISVNGLVGVPVCPCSADFDLSGGTPDATDIDAFFNAWLAGEPNSDVDCSGGTPDATDIDLFFGQWLNGGC
jgi:hypothetical protein